MCVCEQHAVCPGCRSICGLIGLSDLLYGRVSQSPIDPVTNKPAHSTAMQRQVGHRLVLLTSAEALTNYELAADYRRTTRPRNLASLNANRSGVCYLGNEASASAEHERLVYSSPPAVPKQQAPVIAPAKPRAPVAPMAKASRLEPHVFNPSANTRPTQLYGGNVLPYSGTMLILVSGNLGSGYLDLASAMVDELDKQGIASDFIDDESFHMARPAIECELCRSRRAASPCRSCPASLETRSFFQSNREMHDRVQGSARYHRDREPSFPGGRGVIIIAGRSVFYEEALHRVTEVRIWLDEEQNNCVRQIVVDTRKVDYVSHTRRDRGKSTDTLSSATARSCWKASTPCIGNPVCRTVRPSLSDAQINQSRSSLWLR